LNDGLAALLVTSLFYHLNQSALPMSLDHVMHGKPMAVKEVRGLIDILL
jgi:hypothetical protein